MGSLVGSGRGWIRPLLSIVCGLLLAGVLMLLSGYHVGEAYRALWTGATGIDSGPAQGPTQIALGPLPFHINTFLLAQSLARTTPLLFTGLSIAIGLRAGLFNIGAQGQMTLGALAAGVVGLWGSSAHATHIPSGVHLLLLMMAGAVAGALWSALAGYMKAARGVHEVISTIMLNYVALNLASYLVTHSLKDPNDQAPQTSQIAHSAILPALVQGSNLTIGLCIALLAALIFTLLIRRSATGFQIRALGLGAEAAAAAGIPTRRTLILSMALSGALAGLAGAIEVMGVQHRFVQGAASSYGFDGISVALLGGLTGPGVTLSALFFGALGSGAAYMQLQSDVPDSVAIIVQALVILFVGVRTFFPAKSIPLQPLPDDEQPSERSPAEHAAV